MKSVPMEGLVWTQHVVTGAGGGHPGGRGGMKWLQDPGQTLVVGWEAELGDPHRPC